MHRIALLKNSIFGKKTLSYQKYTKITLEDITGEELQKQILHLSKENQQAIVKARMKVIEFFEVRDNSKWSLDKDKNGAQLYSSINKKTGLKLIYRKIKIKASLEDSIQVFKDSDMLTKLNENIKESKKVEDLGINTAYYHNVLKGNMVVSDRDLSLLRHCFTLPDGRYAVVTYSVDHKKIPVTKKRVRALMPLSVYLLTPIGGLYTLCESVQDGDPKGNLPAVLVNSRAGKQLESLIMIKDFIEKRKPKGFINKL